MQNDNLKLRAEFYRKIIHITCSILPLAYYLFLSWEQIIVISGFISIGFVVAEFLRFKKEKFKKWFETVFSKLLREDEKTNKITGATYLFVSLTIIFLIFEKRVSIPAALILTLADSVAAIVGKSFGRTKYFNKTVTGSVAFYLVGLVIFILFLPELGWLSLIIVLLLTVIELLPIPISDNITLPISACLFIELVLSMNGGF